MLDTFFVWRHLFHIYKKKSITLHILISSGKQSCYYYIRFFLLVFLMQDWDRKYENFALFSFLVTDTNLGKSKRDVP